MMYASVMADSYICKDEQHVVLDAVLMEQQSGPCIIREKQNMSLKKIAKYNKNLTAFIAFAFWKIRKMKEMVSVK